MLLSEKALVNVSSIWKVFANLLGTCQVQLYWALFRERGMRLTFQGMGRLLLDLNHTGQNLYENLPKAMLVVR